jgi:hypothetical protein
MLLMTKRKSDVIKPFNNFKCNFNYSYIFINSEWMYFLNIIWEVTARRKSINKHLPDVQFATMLL